MKKNKKRIILILLLLLVLILMIILGKDSYSKYLTQIEGKGVIEVAKWAFLVNGETASITNINLAKTYKANTLAQNTIAPGTRGSFDIKIDTTGSEVGINYNVKFKNENSKPQNLQYTYDGHTVSSIKELEPFLTGTIASNSSEKIKIITIEWNWPYETGNLENDKLAQDIEDTNDGKLLENYSFNVIVTGTQVEPVVA